MTGLVVHALSGGIPTLVASQTARFALYFFIIALSILVLCLTEGWLLENVSPDLSLSLSLPPLLKTWLSTSLSLL